MSACKHKFIDSNTCVKCGWTPPDFFVEEHGSVVLLRPLNAAAIEWLNKNVQSEGWQWFGGALAVEPRYLEPLLEGIGEAGFTV